MNDTNNVPNIEIKHTNDGVVAKVGKVQTGPLPNREEAYREGVALQKMVVQSQKDEKAHPVPSRNGVLVIMIILAVLAGVVVGAFTEWSLSAMALGAAFVFAGEVVAFLWSTTGK
jgi:hypothetical protein